MPTRALIALLALAGTAVLPGAAGASASGRAGAFRSCPQRHLASHDPQGASLPVGGLHVHRIRCSKAARAIRQSTFAATPAGPQFTVPGFTCASPVGPPLPGSRNPRYVHCSHRRQALMFLVPGFS